MVISDLDLFARFVESCPHPMLRVRDDTTILYANAAGRKCLQHFGLSVGGHLKEPLLSEDWKAALKGDLREMEADCLGEVIRFSVVRVEGSDHFNFYGRAITEFKRAQREAELGARLAREIIEATPDAMVVADSSGCITLVNGQFLALFGYGRDELLGKKVEVLIPERFRHGHVRHREAYMEYPSLKRMGARGELCGLAKSGEEIPLEITLSPVRNLETPLVVLAIRDLRVRKELERKLLQTQKLEAIGQLAAGIAHDFNNMLSVVLLEIDALEERLGPALASVKDVVGAIRGAAERSALLTRKILASTRQQAMDIGPVDINAVASGMQRMLERIIGEDVRLVTRLARDLKPVRGNAAQIEQAFLNLAVNARDAMPSGGALTIETSLADLDEVRREIDVADGLRRFVKIAIIDSGVGMDEATKNHLFEPFYTTKAPDKGTGLGLAMVYGIVRQCGGDITVTSAPGEGTRWSIYLPFYEEIAPSETERKQHAVKAARGHETILVVEDEKELQRVTCDLLRKHGYTVIAADNGVEALNAIKASAAVADVILTDVIMPEMSGPEMIRELAKSGPAKMPKVIFLSGYHEGRLSEAGLSVDEVFFLQKPYTSSVLLNKIREVLDGEADAKA